MLWTEWIFVVVVVVFIFEVYVFILGFVFCHVFQFLCSACLIYFLLIIYFYPKYLWYFSFFDWDRAMRRRERESARVSIYWIGHCVWQARVRWLSCNHIRMQSWSGSVTGRCSELSSLRFVLILPMSSVSFVLSNDICIFCLLSVRQHQLKWIFGIYHIVIGHIPIDPSKLKA